ncbi:tRNA (adenine(22)-N(1))-methyltransferase [Streptococcus hyovaginalis]|uniref:tRNA (adenine(22)-N(1))-methyltransferase n=1 Tax=Streptococcus hyovaginalis TaxID=149015 RepID=UPI003AE76777
METYLSKRLSQVAAFIPDQAVLLDVGSDHAYLPIVLVQQGKITRAIAGEVVDGPYQSALANVAQSGLADRIQVRLANGLAAFSPEDGVTAITICGMGGRLIAEILEAGYEKLSDVDRLILQPNNREDDLRRWLQENGFRIRQESILEENKKYYEIIVAEHGEMVLSDEELRFGPNLLKHSNTSFRLKWEGELDKLSYALASIPEHKQQERNILLTKINQIKEVLARVS